MRRGGNEAVPFELSIVNLVDDPTVGGLVVSGHDISQLRATQAALDGITTFDPLTELAQPVTLRAHVERCLDDPKTAVMFLDLNGFRPINDQHGRDIGDEILRRVASGSSRRCARATSSPATAVTSSWWWPAIRDLEKLRALAARLAEGIERPIDLSEGSFRLSASVGLAHPYPDDTPETILARADTAMYMAKQHGEGGGNYPQP